MKLKFFAVLVTIIAVSGWRIEAQTNVAPIIRTNRVKAAPNFREVNGQLYNNTRSKQWEKIDGKIVTVLSNAIVFQQITRVPDTYGQNIYGTRTVTSFKETPGLKLVVRNYPTKNAAVGELMWVKVMRVGTTNYNGDTLELWDYGTPHIAMVVTTNYPPKTTNKN
jgi:hypothetical protein